MVKTSSHNKALSPPSPSKVKPLKDKKSATVRTLFIGAVIDMSWQMAIVVLVPIIGGYELDMHTGTAPLFTIIGFILAMVGTFAVIKRMMNEYGERTLEVPKERK